MKLGKHPPRFDVLTSRRKFAMAQFLSETAPVTPDAMDWLSGISDWGMMQNDKIGLCTVAGLGHKLQSQSAATGSKYTVSDDLVIRDYSAITGYDPRQTDADGYNPTDNGANELDVIQWFERNGFGGETLLGHADVSISNRDHIKKAIHLFNGVYVSVALPNTAKTQETWDVVMNSNENQPGSWGGHAVWMPAFDARRQDHETLDCITWGGRKRMTLDFFRTYCDEAWALLMGDWAAFGSSDFKLGDLQAELQAVTA
jgi:hypothetical protein